MDIPAVTGEYTPGSCRNSRKPMRLPPRHEMRPNSPALHAEQLRFPNQTHKEPRFAWLNSRKSPTTLSQDEKKTDVTSGTQNWLVYPKSTQDESTFPLHWIHSRLSFHIIYNKCLDILYNHPEIWSYFWWLYRASPSLTAKNIINLILVLIIWSCPCVELSLVLLEEGACSDQCILLTKCC